MKKTLSAIFVTLLALMLTGCNNNASGISTTPAPTKPVATKPVQTTPAPTTPPTTPAPTEPTTAEPVDEFAALRISESEAKSNGGTYLKRGGKLYEFIGSWFYTSSYSDALISLGEVPIITIAAGDQVIGYFSSGDGEISLTKMNFVGYTIPVKLKHKSNEGLGITQMGDTTAVYTHDLSLINVVDKKGNPVENIRNLNYGEEYTVYWYTGSQYNEVKMVANCSYYCEDESFKAITIAAELTKDGYAIYDLSGVPAGIYDIPGGIIKIE